MTTLPSFPEPVICKKSMIPRQYRLNLLKKKRKPMLKLSDKSVTPLVVFFRRSRKTIQKTPYLKNIKFPAWHIQRIQYVQSCLFRDALNVSKNPDFRLESCLLVRTDSSGLGVPRYRKYIIPRLQSSAEFLEVVMKRQVKLFLETKALSRGKAMACGLAKIPGHLMELIANATLAMDSELFFKKC